VLGKQVLSLVPGTSPSSWAAYSVRGGVQYIIRMQWQLWNGNWWLEIEGGAGAAWVGYYPGRPFNGGQLTRNATAITYGGETVGTNNWPPMGSGGFAAGGFGQAAYQRTVFYIDAAGVSRWSNLAGQQPSPLCYTFAFTGAAAGGAWGSYFFFGGPGGAGC
jgi:hypothetical protein